jgi:DNA-binding MarR family transcriptional regulator
MTRVKNAAAGKLFARMEEAGFGDVREGHGCVFGFIDMENGSRLTDLAEAAGFTKQAVGEAVAELERLGYLERRACVDDGRAKIIHLTERGREATLTGRRIFAEIEAEWAEELGEDVVGAFREAAERIVELEREPASAGPVAAQAS